VKYPVSKRFRLKKQNLTSLSPRNTGGRHLLVEYSGCDPKILNDPKIIEDMMLRAAEAAGTIPLNAIFRPFDPQGVTGIIVIAESHLSIHTWPEHRYAAVDFFTCGRGIAELAHLLLFKELSAERAECLSVDRGQDYPRFISIRSHEIQMRGDKHAPQTVCSL
jgi:S-adenosylmethionine decarboxylase